MKQIVRCLVLPWMLAALVSAEEPDVLFEDTFDEKLGDGWTWLRENAGAWHLKDGGLQILVEPGKADTVKNALVRQAPNRASTNFAVEVTITFTTDPTQQYEQGGITWYHQNKPVFKLVHEHIDGENWIIPGRKLTATKTVQLRLVIAGTRWTAQFREGAEDEFHTAATGQLPPSGDDHVSIQCYEGPPDAEHWIRFDDFRIVELRD